MRDVLSAFLGFWDRTELWLVTLPFALQVLIMLVVGLPLFLVAASGVERVADLLVRGFRRLVSSRPVESGKETR